MLSPPYFTSNQSTRGPAAEIKDRHQLPFEAGLRSERNSDRAKAFFAFGPREIWGVSKKVEGRGWGRGKKGTLARDPLDFEKPVSPRTGLLIIGARSHLD